MSNWSDLKKAVANVIKTNGNQEITGQKLQDVLNNIISNLGKNYQFVDIATPSTNPGTPDGNVFYIAYSEGTYTNFSGITLSSDEFAFLLYNGSWTKKKIGLATEEFLNAFYSSVCYLECNTAANTANKTISNSNYELTKNCRFVIKMINANTNASPTLNINNTGAKPILYNGKNADNVNSWVAGDLLDVFYDGNNYHFYKMLGGSGGNMILEWDADIATTRKQVKASDRKAGMQISYLHPNNGWTNEQYVGTAVTDTEWVKDDNWQSIATGNDISSLKKNLASLENDFSILEEEMPQEQHVDVDEDGFYIIDIYGNIAFGVKPDGSVLGGGDSTGIDLIKVDDF